MDMTIPLNRQGGLPHGDHEFRQLVHAAGVGDGHSCRNRWYSADIQHAAHGECQRAVRRPVGRPAREDLPRQVLMQNDNTAGQHDFGVGHGNLG